MARRLFSVTLAVVLGATVSTAISARGSSAATSIRLYAPFGAAGVAAGITVARTVSGYCWTASLADPRSDAYRCFVGNYIHDPCFANTTGSSSFVLCPLYLPTSKVLRINLTKRLPRNPSGGDPTRFRPWVMQLASGRWCEMFTGATGVIAGMRINYGCIGGGILLGTPRRETPTWTILYARTATAKTFRAVRVRAAWW